MGRDEQIAEALDAYWTSGGEMADAVMHDVDPATFQTIRELERTLRSPRPRPAFLHELRGTLLAEAHHKASVLPLVRPPLRRRSLLPHLTAALVLLAGLVAITPIRDAAVEAANGIMKVIHNAEAGLTDQEREAIHQAAHQRNYAFLRAFVAQHRDPQSLPPIWIQTYALPPPTLEAAEAASGLIVSGHVQSLTFSVNPSGGMPIATSRIRVDQTIKGALTGNVTVTQLGGPVAHGPGGALAEMVKNELVLPGDEVVLFLQRSGMGHPWHTITGGVYFVRNGAITSQSSQYYGVRGEPVARFITRLSAPRRHGP